jgi:hypothetical protein
VRLELIRMLTPLQRQRLRQVFLQYLGPFAFNDPELVERLGLSPDQRQHIRVIQAEEFTPLYGPGSRSGSTLHWLFGWSRDGADAREKAMERILESLTPHQRETWQTLTGKPFTVPRPQRPPD